MLAHQLHPCERGKRTKKRRAIVGLPLCRVASCDGARVKRYESRYVAGVYVAGLLEAHQRKLMGRGQEEVVARAGDTLANDNAIRGDASLRYVEGQARLKAQRSNECIHTVCITCVGNVNDEKEKGRESSKP